MDAIPLELIFAGTIIFISIAIWLGNFSGQRTSAEKKKQIEKYTSSSASILFGMLSFILVFSFGIVYSRFDDKKAHVREEAEVIRMAYLRADFLPEAEMRKSKTLMKEYIEHRINTVISKDNDEILKETTKSEEIHNELWKIAVANGKLDLNSDVGALYIEAINNLIGEHHARYITAMIARLPNFLWIILYMLVFLGMFANGYQGAIEDSKKGSLLTPVLVLSFALIITLIAGLDGGQRRYIKISQQPLIEVKEWMVENSSRTLQ